MGAQGVILVGFMAIWASSDWIWNLGKRNGLHQFLAYLRPKLYADARSPQLRPCSGAPKLGVHVGVVASIDLVRTLAQARFAACLGSNACAVEEVFEVVLSCATHL